MLISRQAPPGGSQEADAPSAGEGAGADGGSAAVAGGSGGGGDGGVPLVELKSFTTQAFFTCWRALHLGVLQVS